MHQHGQHRAQQQRWRIPLGKQSRKIQEHVFGEGKCQPDDDGELDCVIDRLDAVVVREANDQVLGIFLGEGQEDQAEGHHRESEPVKYRDENRQEQPDAEKVQRLLV